MLKSRVKSIRGFFEVGLSSVGLFLAIPSVIGYAQAAQYVVRNLGSTVNSAKNDFAPSLTADGQTIFFTSSRSGGVGQEDLWMCTRPEDGDTQWSEPINLSEINSDGSEGAVSIAADGQTVYFATNQEALIGGDVDIWEATLEGVQWTHPKPLQGEVNGMSWESQPSISSDGQNLYFASNRPGKIGSDSVTNVDLFVSHKLADGSWGDPVNLGSKINTSRYEGGPFIAPDGVTLYFSSNAHGSMGGLDIFRTERVGPTDTDWTVPERLPEPINSTANDMFPTVCGSGLSLIFASDRSGGNGQYDLWEATQSPATESALNQVKAPGDNRELQLSVAGVSASSRIKVMIGLASPSDFSLTLLDVAGRPVCELAKGYSAGGASEFPFETKSLPSGNYFVRLSSQGLVKVAPVAVRH